MRAKESGRREKGGRVGGESTNETYLPISQRIENGLLDPLGVIVQTHVLQHHHAAQQQRRRIRERFARDIGRGTVHGLEDGTFVADISRGREAQPADQAGTHVGQDVAVEVRHDEDFVVVGRRVGDDFQARVVEEFGVEFDVGEVLADFTGDAEEQTVGHLHDCSFVHGANLSLADVFGVLEGEA